MTTATRTVFRTCTLCEACCGLRFEVAGDRITSVRPDDEDVLSRGFVCPKGVAIADVHHDPDRIRQPLVRGADGALRPATWDEAFAAAAMVTARGSACSVATAAALARAKRSTSVSGASPSNGVSSISAGMTRMS